MPTALALQMAPSQCLTMVPTAPRFVNLKAARWTAISALLIVGGLWSHATPSEVIVRFAVDAGAILSMAGALARRRYVKLALSAAVAVLYNPLAPVFGLAGAWQRALIVAFAIPFLSLLIWREMKGDAT